jgi:hypothetical protein
MLITGAVASAVNRHPVLVANPIFEVGVFRGPRAPFVDVPHDP